MKRLSKWFVVSLVVATMLLTLTVAFGWTSSSISKDLSLFAACYQVQ